MEEIILKALPRTESPKKVRKAGFIPGVLNESNTNSTDVQFETTALNKVIAKHGSNAKIWVELGSDKKFGFIKEVQKHPVEGKVIHISIQLVEKDQVVKMHLPITFHGREDLEHKSLQLLICKSDVEVIGKATLMPDMLVADISKKELGENVTAIDFHIPADLKILDAEHEIYAVIKASKEVLVEEPEETEATEGTEEVKPAE